MDNLQNYMRSINPKDPHLIFGQKYHIWQGEEYQGIAVWVNDANIGPCFQQREGHNVEVCLPDTWQPVNEA